MIGKKFKILIDVDDDDDEDDEPKRKNENLFPNELDLWFGKTLILSAARARIFGDNEGLCQ